MLSRSGHEIRKANVDNARLVLALAIMAPTKAALRYELHHLHHPTRDPVALAKAVAAAVEVAPLIRSAITLPSGRKK